MSTKSQVYQWFFLQACFFGPVAAGKTKAADACLKMVGGSKQSKTDHQTKSQTIKKGMAFRTMPKVVDDMKSNSAAGNLVVSNFDDNTYETSEGEFESYCETILTTNYIWDMRIISRCDFKNYRAANTYHFWFPFILILV